MTDGPLRGLRIYFFSHNMKYEAMKLLSIIIKLDRLTGFLTKKQINLLDFII